MRATWIILLITILVGTGMYFLSKRKPKPADYDTIVFQNTPDSIIKKMSVYLAYDPKEVMYLDSIWVHADSTPLKQVLVGVDRDTMSKQYSFITLYFTYDNHSFYDLEIKKPNPKLAYNINIQIEPQNNDTLIVDGLIEPQEGDAMHFRNPMMKMYPKFVVTYNYKLPQPPPDSTAIKGHDANKTITILQH